MTTKIKVTHLDRTGSLVGKPFIADLTKYKNANYSNGFVWDDVLTDFYNGKHHTTINMPYGNVKLEVIANNNTTGV